MNSKTFAQQFLLEEVERMSEAGVKLQLLSAMMHGIEASGALLDTLPFKAKGQGKKRFNLALRKLFPPAYVSANKQVNLYSQLRSHLAHCMLPAKTIKVLVGPSDKHLEYSEKLLNISLELLYKDYRCAIETLIEMLESDQLKIKKIAFGNLDSLNV